jgi:alkylation response protein AidB-like acyl-CoA dehydrogenase
MDLADTPEQEGFRKQVRSWLKDNVPREPPPSYDTREGFEARRAWERKLHDAGYAGLHWPAEYGGRGADVVTQAIFEEEYFLADGPSRITIIGQNLMGPTLIVHGTEEQKKRWLPGIISAEEIWSQGFSEPGAGSDLAGIKARGVREGDHWIINGQKIWTSFGAFADWIFALVRTDPDAPRHAGLTFIAIDMRSEGVEARPIRQLDGHSGFAEIFFTDVRVPAANVIGEPGAGWGVAMTTLGFERDAPSKPAARYIRDVIDLAKLIRGLEDPVIEDRVVALYARAQAYRHHTMRTLTRLARGESIGPDASVTKLLWSELERDIFDTAREAFGPDAEVEPGPGGTHWHAKYWFSRAATIYAGTSEIQRNIVAERVLGLPRS